MSARKFLGQHSSHFRRPETNASASLDSFPGYHCRNESRLTKIACLEDCAESYLSSVGCATSCYCVIQYTRVSTLSYITCCGDVCHKDSFRVFQCHSPAG